MNILQCSKNQYDVAVIGGGIIGAAVAKTIKDHANHAKIALFDKESDFGKHQSSHNSQVIHAGIYYRTNSLKGKLCAEGSKLIYDYCDSHNIPVKKIGKLIIGKTALDKIRLKELYRRGTENKVPGLELLDKKKIDEIQPNCKGVQALWSPNSGNINWEAVTKSLGQNFRRKGGEVFLSCEVKRIKESSMSSYPLKVDTAKGSFLAKYAIICLGLHSGTLYDSERNYKNISLKVNYYFLNPKLHRFIKTNIYAMPHLDLPFLGIHFSPTVDGNVLLGPNAVPTFKLDGYSRTSFDFRYVKEHVFSRGLGLLFLKNFRSCWEQVTEQFFGKVRTSALKEYFPMMAETDVFPGPTGVQGQIVTNEGDFVDDFLIEIFEGTGIQKRIINCRFVPSPGATCSLAIAKMIESEIAPRLV